MKYRAGPARAGEGESHTFFGEGDMTGNTLRCALAGIALILVSAAVTAFAQSYPLRPIRLLTPNAPGGGLDVIARFIAPALTDNLGKAVVVIRNRKQRS